MRTLMLSATSLLTVDLVAEALEMPEKSHLASIKYTKTLGTLGYTPAPLWGS